MFEGQKRLDLDIQNEDISMEWLIDYLKKNHLKDKEEMFVQGNSVRPGIIVLINDTDWELLETINYKVQEKDSIAFISTLHGG